VSQRIFTALLFHCSSAQMLSPAPTPVNTPIMPADARPDPPLRAFGGITYDRERNGYNLEWESRAEFKRWLTNEQQAIGIEIWQCRTKHSKAQGQQVYLTRETFRCAHNQLGGTKPYMKKTMWERKIESKRIEGGCPCLVEIKTYPHTDTILGKYNHDHSHPTGKDNLRYIRIRVATCELIEAWVHYGVTDQEIVSDPLFNHD
jgi:hypothetical protein